MPGCLLLGPCKAVLWGLFYLVPFAHHPSAEHFRDTAATQEWSSRHVPSRVEKKVNYFLKASLTTFVHVSKQGLFRGLHIHGFFWEMLS